MMDGSKEMRKAVEEIFGRYALVQRCQWHKRENVVDYLLKASPL
jgi:putative transposase